MRQRRRRIEKMMELCNDDSEAVDYLEAEKIAMDGAFDQSTDDSSLGIATQRKSKSTVGDLCQESVV